VSKQIYNENSEEDSQAEKAHEFNTFPGPYWFRKFMLVKAVILFSFRSLIIWWRYVLLTPTCPNTDQKALLGTPTRCPDATSPLQIHITETTFI